MQTVVREKVSGEFPLTFGPVRTAASRIIAAGLITKS